MWNKLSMAEKAKYIKRGVQYGLTDLDDIKKGYNILSKGGYLDWIERVKKWKPGPNNNPETGIALDINSDNPTYDYEGFYNENPEYAWEMLNEDSNAHFSDKYKKPNHPTFSDESVYSNNSTEGGHWRETLEGKSFYVPSKYTGTEERINEIRDYLTNTGEGYIDREGNLRFPFAKEDRGDYNINLPEIEVYPSYALGGRVNKFDGESQPTQQMNYEARNPYLRELGIGQRPYSDFATANNMTFYDGFSGEKLNHDNVDENTMVWVDPYKGTIIPRDSLILDDKNNLVGTSTIPDITIRPYYGYREVYKPYHDTFRMYKDPVKTGTQDDDPYHPIIPFGENEYFETPQLIGEDNWTDPSENFGEEGETETENEKYTPSTLAGWVTHLVTGDDDKAAYVDVGSSALNTGADTIPLAGNVVGAIISAGDALYDTGKLIASPSWENAADLGFSLLGIIPGIGSVKDVKNIAKATKQTVKNVKTTRSVKAIKKTVTRKPNVKSNVRVNVLKPNMTVKRSYPLQLTTNPYFKLTGTAGNWMDAVGDTNTAIDYFNAKTKKFQ